MATHRMSANPHNLDISKAISSQAMVPLKVNSMASSNNIRNKATPNRAMAIHSRAISSREGHSMGISKGSLWTKIVGTKVLLRESLQHVPV